MIRAKAFSVVTTVLFLAFTTTQAQNWDWSLSAGGKDIDYATGMVNDAQGNLYVTGSFNGTATFGDKQLTSNGYYDIFLAKYNSLGKLLWISQAGGTEGDEANGIAVDANNNVYIVGYFSGKANFGNQTVTSKGDRDFFIAKYDSNGQPVWVQPGGGENAEFGKAIALGVNGNLYVTGIFGGNASFKNKLLKSKGNEDIFIADYSVDGDLLWIDRIGGNGKDEATAIATDTNGNAYITGWFSGTADFGRTNLSSDGDDDIFIAKYDAKGECKWSRQAGGYKGVDRSFAITCDAGGNCYVTGSFNAQSKFSNITLKSVGTDDCFFAKYDTNGNLEFAKQSSGKNGEIGRAIALDKSGNIFVCGDFNATFICNSTQLCIGDWDVFIVKYDSKGNVLGANHAGGEGYDRPIAMSIDKNDNCYITGVYEKTCLFGKHELTNRGNSDIFIAKTKSFDPVL